MRYRRGCKELEIIFNGKDLSNPARYFKCQEEVDYPNTHLSQKNSNMTLKKIGIFHFPLKCPKNMRLTQNSLLESKTIYDLFFSYVAVICNKSRFLLKFFPKICCFSLSLRKLESGDNSDTKAQGCTRLRLCE